MTLSPKEKRDRLKKILYFANLEVFKVSLVFYLLLYLLNDILEGGILNYLDINILLMVAIISGVFSVASTGRLVYGGESRQKVGWISYIFILILGIIVSGVIYIKIKDIGSLSYYIAILAGIISIIGSIYIFHQDSQPKDSSNGQNK